MWLQNKSGFQFRVNYSRIVKIKREKIFKLKYMHIFLLSLLDAQKHSQYAFVRYSIKSEESFRRVAMDYSRRVKVDIRQLKFEKGIEPLNLIKTIDELEIKHGDIIYVSFAN